MVTATMSETQALAVLPPRRGWRRMLRSQRTLGLLGFATLILVWWLLAATVLEPMGTVPTPGEVVAQLWRDGAAFYVTNAAVTALEALQGYAIGVGIAVAVALLVLLIPRLSGVAMQLAVVVSCIPIMAIGPVIYLVIGAPRSGEPSGTAMVLAAMCVFFTTLVMVLLGLKSVDRQALELVTAYGGGKWQRLIRVELLSSVPSLLRAMQLAAPAAILGAILGEYVGGVDRGLGPALATAQSTQNVDRVWAIAMVCALLTGIWWGLVALLAGVVTRLGWGATTASPTSTRVAAPIGTRAFRSIATGVVSLCVVVVAWPLALLALGVSPFVGKTPLHIWTYFVTSPDAAANRAEMGTALGQTMFDTLIGFAAGLLAALLVAILFMIVPAVEHAVVPFALLMRSVPLLALAPVVILIFGRGIPTIIIMGTLIVFFPSLITITMGLRSTPPAMTDLMHALGGSVAQDILMVRLPAAIPAVFAAVKIAIPGALAAALLAEWLATGQGIGYVIISAIGRSDNTQVWAAVVCVTATSMLLYGLASIAEQAARKRWA